MLTVFPHFQQPKAQEFECEGLQNLDQSKATEALMLVTNEYMDFLLNIFFIVLDCKLRHNEACWRMDYLLDYSNYPVKTWELKLR